MSMKTQKMKKENDKKPNLNKATIIQVALKTRRIKQADIAAALKISQQAVNRSIYGLTTITRVDDWCRENLGIEVSL